MARGREPSGFRSGFEQGAALFREGHGRFVTWRLWSPRMGMLSLRGLMGWRYDTGIRKDQKSGYYQDVGGS